MSQKNKSSHKTSYLMYNRYAFGKNIQKIPQYFDFSKNRLRGKYRKNILKGDFYGKQEKQK